MTRSVSFCEEEKEAAATPAENRPDYPVVCENSSKCLPRLFTEAGGSV